MSALAPSPPRQQPPLRGVLARLLEARRDRYNAAFAQARHARPRLDPELFARHLCAVVAPLVERIAEVEVAAADAAAEVLYDLSLEMVGTDLLGGAHPLLEVAWSELLPALARHVARAPRRVAGSVCNAVHQMSATRGAQVEAWISGMKRASDRAADVDQLLEFGKALAWRCGMAHYREGALDVLARLPDDLAASVLWTDGEPQRSVAEVLPPMRARRWLRPGREDGRLQIVNRVGGFRGFGGLFVKPPAVSASDGQLYATDGAEHWLITADVFGVTFHRCEPPRSTSSGPFKVTPDGTVREGGDSRLMPVLARARSQASTPDTLAVTLPLSHHVFLVARS